MKVWSIFVKVIKVLVGLIGVHNDVIGTTDDTKKKE